MKKLEINCTHLSAEDARKLFLKHGISPNEIELFGITDSTKNPFNVDVYFENFAMRITPNCKASEIKISADYCFSRQFEMAGNYPTTKTPTNRTKFSLEKLVPYGKFE